GLHLSPAQMFQHQTVAELAAVVSTAGPVQPEQGEVTGPVPLTPIQCWFFEQELPDYNYNRQVLTILHEAPLSLEQGLVEQAVRILLQHHDALRLRYRATATGWRQECAAADGPVPVCRIDLSHLSAAEQTA